MNKYLVAVVNSSQARLLTLEPSDLSEYNSGFNLVEQINLKNPTQERQGQDLWSSVKTGRNRGSSGHSHSYDDHRESHMVEFERRFAQTIAATIENFIQTHQPQKLLLIAEPQVLGLMRDALNASLPKTVKSSELAKDLCHLKPNDLHTYLADKKLLPVQKRAVT
jgi:protein required for attachment to host cells